MEKNNTVYIKRGKELLSIDLLDVYLISSDSNYCIYYWGDERGIKLGVIREIINVLPNCFFMVSRKEIVNLNYKVSITCLGIGNGGIIVLSNGKEIKISRRQLVILNRRLKNEALI